MKACEECFQTQQHRSGCPNEPEDSEPCQTCDGDGEGEPQGLPCAPCREAGTHCIASCEDCKGKGYIDGVELEERRAEDKADALEREWEMRRDMEGDE